MYSKLINVVLVFAATFAATGAVPRDNVKKSQHIKARASSTGSTTQVSCNGYKPWMANTVYSDGSQVIYNNQLWTAKQTPSGSPESSDGWTQYGYCYPLYSKEVYCNYVPQWNKDTAYSGGSWVIYNGHLWICIKSAQSYNPSSYADYWKDLGACYSY
ncbi:uncharacterized protein EDB91DRAFT_1248001 [Suillus paluster]|uniref:uncharacterized protein n=1 Tax=Suillus paluster TaxID=48578 RepID=UPI001B87D260|nr:uncharacterized protein EDB91DRAFT_1248001 [Suillus paluster]KAG1741447.1 hypothetical protein EDB91DRAFT_1248001 [Suillus paluster]